VEKGVRFLSGVQLEDGELRTFACRDQAMRDCEFDSSPFVTALIVSSLRRVQGADKIRKSAAAFLAREQAPDGTWNYWSRKNPKRSNLRSDVDVTASAALALKETGVPFIEETGALKTNENKDGLLLTWLGGDAGKGNDLDCVVNLNAAIRLPEVRPAVCSYVNGEIRSGKDCSVYYRDRLALDYFLARAFARGVSCLGDAKQAAVEEVLKGRAPDGGFGDDLQTALAVNALLHLGYSGKETQDGLSALLRRQRDDGSWSRGQLYQGPAPYYGSEELTTALAVEALAGSL
jgi:hypothetical protein